MQELEKTLEDIESRIEYLEKIKGKYEDGNEKMAIWFRINEIKRIKKIIHKYMNDGWIPVEKDLPKNESEVWVVLESTYGTGYRTYSSARYLYFENYGEVIGATIIMVILNGINIQMVMAEVRSTR